MRSLFIINLNANILDIIVPARKDSFAKKDCRNIQIWVLYMKGTMQLEYYLLRSFIQGITTA